MRLMNLMTFLKEKYKLKNWRIYKACDILRKNPHLVSYLDLFDVEEAYSNIRTIAGQDEADHFRKTFLREVSQMLRVFKRIDEVSQVAEAGHLEQGLEALSQEHQQMLKDMENEGR